MTRRAALGAAAGGLLAALGLGHEADAQVTQARCGNERCRNNPGRCNDGCVCCVYSNGNSRCRPPGTCAPGQTVCPDGEVVDPALGCVAPPTTTTPTTSTTTTTTTTPPAIGDCQGTASGGACGPDGAGICDNGRCFRAEPNCDGGGCGVNFGNVPATALPGVVFCVPISGSISDTPCQTSADCAAAGRPGEFCGGPFTGGGQSLCSAGCLV